MKEYIRALLHRDVRLPRFLHGVVRMVYRFCVILHELFLLVWGILVVKPVMQAIAEGGRRLRIERVPYMRGKGHLLLGDDVYLSGLVTIFFHQREKLPVLRVGDRSFIGHACFFALSDSIEIGDDCMIGAGTRIIDNDGHPLSPSCRLRREKVSCEDIRPVQIGANVWIAPDCKILKGVSIGDNAVVGTGSVVTHDVPANVLVAGSPTRVIREL